MRLLLLGGTLFLGRHNRRCGAVARAHDLLTRGRRPVPWTSRVKALQGDRDPRTGAGLAALEAHTFDTSGYVPRVVASSACLLESRVRRYLFVSSVSVFARFGYWPARFVHLALLGDRAARAVAPAPQCVACVCTRKVRS